jgi:AcrR family transcriptional regulator
VQNMSALIFDVHMPPIRKTARPASTRKRRAAPRKGRRAEHKEATRRRIVSAALTLFQAKGFDATTTKAIAKRAGIAEGTVFNYFASKDEIALHFFETEVEDAIESVRGNPKLQKAPLEEKLFALIERQLELLAPYERFIGNAFVEALRPASNLGIFSHRANALRHRYLAFVDELLSQSLPPKTLASIRWWAPDAFWVFYMVALLYWLNDSSPRKQHTLAFLDRSLRIGVGIVNRAV